ncbi:MAG: outer membrane protein assembly factor BamB [Gammaproteobacteria bacterium]|nr:outer membrane protein assembly factor BamB [Gammaproteobacteria bacterium]
MYSKKIINILTLLFIGLLAGCNGFFETDNAPSPAPLPRFKPEISPHAIWSAQIGSGTEEYLKKPIGSNSNAIFVTRQRGTVAKINKQTGRICWQINTTFPITTGVAVNEDVVVFGTQKGETVALSTLNGAMFWRAQGPGEILATPVLAQNRVVVKYTNGYVRALSLEDGHELWSYQQTEPALILRGSSTPLVKNNNVIVGFANGNLAKLNANLGDQLWSQPVAIPQGAFAIERMVDINADPVMYHDDLYAATYQGKIAMLNWLSGTPQWTRDISSYTGMVADRDAVYISDAQSHLWSFNAQTGATHWQQGKLLARGITAPAALRNYLIVGDHEGYIHWLSKDDGRFVARTTLGGPIYTAPLVDENEIVYVWTAQGQLTAYKS